MKVLILNPPSLDGIGFVREGRCEQKLSSYQYVLLPVSLVYIASVLKKHDFKVKIIDAVAEKIECGTLIKMVGKYSPRLIILNVSTVTFNNDMKVAEKIKKFFPHIHISAIGVHVTALPGEALSYRIDSVIRREPEITAYKLALAVSREGSFKKVLGLSYKEKSKKLHNPDRSWIKKLDNLPFPARELVKNEKYLMAMSKKPHTVLVSSRGCNQNCIFCTARQYYGNELRLRSAKNVADEMEEVKRKFKINYITMWSDTFTLDRDFVINLCKEINKRKLKVEWMCNSRVDTVDEEMLEMMKRAGCIGIAFGVESGVQEILNRAGKNTKIWQIKLAFEMMRKVGIESLAHFIFGLPGETKKTIKETIKFAKEIDPDYAQFYCAVPFPGTPLRTLCEQNKWIATTNWRDYEINQAVVETEHLSRKELENARRFAYISFYFRPRYVWKRFSKVKSIGDFFFLLTHSYRFFRDWGVE